MKVSEIQELKEKLKPKIELGDYITVGKMLNIAQSTARMRCTRNKEDAVIALKAVIDAREALIKNHQS